MTIYLDNSFLNRPFDNPESGVNKLEAEVLLLNSSVIEYENSLNPFPDRKIFVQEILKHATSYQIDALHLAAGEEAKVDLFITCDYNLIRKYQGKTKVVTPLEFFSNYEHTNQ